MKLINCFGIAGFLLVCYAGDAQKNTKTVTDNSVNSKKDTTKLVVIGIGDPIPDSCKTIGPVNVGDNGSDLGCDYPTILDIAKKITMRVGGNILKINSTKKPDHRCECYRLYGTVLYRKNIWNIKISKTDDSITKLKFGDTAKFAILYIYRSKGSEGTLMGYDVHIGDSVICRAKNNSAYEIRLYKEGEVQLWARTESKSKASFNVKFGQEYFLRCSIVLGWFGYEPYIKLVDKIAGQEEYNNIIRERESK